MEKYLYLYLRDAKINIINNYKKLNITKNFGKEVRKNINKTWKKLPDYAQKRDSVFESWIQSAMNNTSYNTGNVGAANVSSAISIGELSGIASKMPSIRRDGQLLKQAVAQLNQALNILDKADKQFSQNILNLALSDPYIKAMLQISIPDGIYQVNNDSFRVNDSIQKALETANSYAEEAIRISQSMSCSSVIGRKEDDALSTILIAIENIISSNRGFLYEVEVLQGLLLSVKEGHTAVVHTGQIGKAKIDSKLQSELGQVDSLLGQLAGIVSSIGIANPKADLMCAINKNGVVSIFGVSVKSVSPSKFKAIQSGNGAKNVSIGFGSTYKTLQQIFNEHNNIISQTIGGYDPSWYGAQILTGWEEGHKENQTDIDGGGGQYTAAWNQILNICAMLTFSDALVGIGEKTLQGGFATYLVINNQVYWMKDVLNKAALAIEKGEMPGIYGKTTSTLNRKWGQELQQRSYVDDFIGPTKVSNRRAAALQRSANVWSEWNAQMEKQILKVNMSLGALKNIANKAGLMPII